MRGNDERNNSTDSESNGINRRSFIAKTIFAGAGIAALAASQNQASAQTGQRKNELASNMKVAADSLPGAKNAGHVGGLIDRFGRSEHEPQV